MPNNIQIPLLQLTITIIYIRELVLRVSNNKYTRRLRSADTMNLVTPRTRKGIGDEFSYASNKERNW